MKNFKPIYSINFNKIARSTKKITYLIYHYTGMKSENKAIERLCDKKSKVSCHYFIKKNGTIINMVPDKYIAWHAGISSWKNFKSCCMSFFFLLVLNKMYSLEIFSNTGKTKFLS